MSIKLLELRKFTIEKRVDVCFKDKNSNELCVVDKHGIAKIPGKNTFKEPFHINVEEALKAATEFIIEDGKGRQIIAVEKMAEMIADVLKPRTPAGHGTAAKKEED